MNGTHYLEFMVFPARIKGRWILCLAHVEWSIHVPTWTLPAVETSIALEVKKLEAAQTDDSKVQLGGSMYLVIKP